MVPFNPPRMQVYAKCRTAGCDGKIPVNRRDVKAGVRAICSKCLREAAAAKRNEEAKANG